MTPKEKAQDLFNKFYNVEHLVGYLHTRECKVYASIIVDEILNLDSGDSIANNLCL